MNSLEGGSTDSTSQLMEKMRHRKASYVMMFGRTIRRLSTLVEEDEEVEDEEELREESGEEEETVRERQLYAAQKDAVRCLLTSESTEMKLFDRKFVISESS